MEVSLEMQWSRLKEMSHRFPTIYSLDARYEQKHMVLLSKETL
jgi:hypothetical protein